MADHGPRRIADGRLHAPRVRLIEFAASTVGVHETVEPEPPPTMPELHTVVPPEFLISKMYDNGVSLPYDDVDFAAVSTSESGC